VEPGRDPEFLVKAAVEKTVVVDIGEGVLEGEFLNLTA